MNLILMLILTNLFLPQYPPAPDYYGEWHYYHYYPFDDSPSLTLNQNITRTTNNNTNLPYRLDADNLHYFTGIIDSLSGQIHHCPDSLSCHFCWSEEEKNWGYIFVKWTPHLETSTKPIDSLLMPLNFLYGYGYYSDVTIDTTGPDTLTIDGRKSYRLRGRWRNGQCDGQINTIGSFTTYFLSTARYDFRITCRSEFYYHSCETGTDEVSVYPDRIAELEQAVEQTFRVK